MKLIKLFGFIGFSALVACTAATSDDGSSPGESDDIEAETTEEALTSGTSTYYAVRRDFRRCISPLCGGFWVNRVNATSTRCADGTSQPACYVTDLNLAALDLSAAKTAEVTSDPSRLVLRGYVNSKTHPNFGKLGTFRATEAWRAPAAGAATGIFYVVDDSNIRCFRAPCPSIRERKLNSSAAAKNITGVDLADAPGTDDEKSDAISFIAAKGLIVAGANIGPANERVLDGSQFFAPVQKSVALPAGSACFAGDTCGGGTKCCYPCGIQGCTNRCITPTSSGQCPMFP